MKVQINFKHKYLSEDGNVKCGSVANSGKCILRSLHDSTPRLLHLYRFSRPEKHENFSRPRAAKGLHCFGIGVQLRPVTFHLRPGFSCCDPVGLVIHQEPSISFTKNQIKRALDQGFIPTVGEWKFTIYLRRSGNAAE